MKVQFLPVQLKKRSHLRVSLLYLAALLLLLMMYLQPYVPINQLTRDAMAVAKGKFYFGALSNIGLLLWNATASICLFTHFTLGKVNFVYGNFFLSAGLFSLMLLLDDMFMIHEEVFHHYLGINEMVLLLFYPLFISYFLLRYRHIIMRTSYLILLSALCCMAGSLAIDFVFSTIQDKYLLFEDGFKFLGIVGWSCYFCETCVHVLKSRRQLNSGQKTPRIIFPIAKNG